jgi:hypothetical protein
MPPIQRQAQQMNPKSKGPPVIHKLLVSLEDLYSGTKKKMRITSKRYDQNERFLICLLKCLLFRGKINYSYMYIYINIYMYGTTKKMRIASKR